MITTRNKELGIIRIDGSMTISDPCYEPGIWCALQMEVVPGWYRCYAEYADISDWGRRITSLTAVREDYADNIDALDWDIAGDAGVDSGQMGIYDTEYFKDNQPDDDYDNPDSWYRQVCDLTCDLTYNEEEKHLDASIIDERGCVSASGYGDGCYEVISYINKDGDIVGAKVVFIEVYEEE